MLLLYMPSLAAEAKTAKSATEIFRKYVKEAITPALVKTGSTHRMPQLTSKAPYQCHQVGYYEASCKDVQLLMSSTEVLPGQAAVATDAVATAYHAIFRRGDIKKHETVFLFGLGGLGMNALQLLLHIGAEVIVSDTRQACLDRALSLGVPASHIVPLGTGPQEFVLDNFKGVRIDAVLDFVGKHQTFQDAQQIGRFKARRV
jgi:D-arabinose 1-dehydrogenase-like Zn-dependent alcohol dehydrogenase